MSSTAYPHTTEHPAVDPARAAECRFWLTRIIKDPRYGWSNRKAALARAYGIQWNNLRRKAIGIIWIQPWDVDRILEVSKKIREGRLRPKFTRMWRQQFLYDPVEVENPVPPVTEMHASIQLDFRGVRLTMMPVAPPARRIQAPEGIFGRVSLKAPKGTRWRS